MEGALEQEAGYREAIAAGNTDAWNSLGLLLAKLPGREVEAEAAYREAIACAATDRIREAAAENHGYLLARLGDLVGARAAFERYARARSGRMGCELTDSQIAMATRFKTAVARRPRALRLMRWVGRLASALWSRWQPTRHRIRRELDRRSSGRTHPKSGSP